MCSTWVEEFRPKSRKREDHQSAQHLPRGAEDLERAGIHVGGLGDAGEMLDDQAKAAYRRRLSELHEELEEAKEAGNVTRAEQAEEEIDALTRELSRAVGLGGRNRRAASASERARQSITKSIKAVLERIAQSNAALGDILSRSIKTGTFCSYQPERDFPIAWEFGVADPVSIAEPEVRQSANRETDPARANPSKGSVAKGSWRCWRFRRSRRRNEPRLWVGISNVPRFARPSIVHLAAMDRW